MNLRIPRHQVFKGLAGRGKSSTGWFYGFKLHLVINHVGDLMNVFISAGNHDDRKPVLDLGNTRRIVYPFSLIFDILLKLW